MGPKAKPPYAYPVKYKVPPARLLYFTDCIHRKVVVVLKISLLPLIFRKTKRIRLFFAPPPQV